MGHSDSTNAIPTAPPCSQATTNARAQPPHHQTRIPSSSNNTFGAYPGSSTERANSATFRTATPDKRGAYSDAVLSELESQNDEQVSEMSKKVGMLKDVSLYTF
jgi:hypothetical protein